MSVAALIVTYNSDDDLIKSILELKKQVDKVIIIDNGSSVETIQILRDIEEKYSDFVEIKFLHENVGLAAAQNVGIDIAMASSPSWILFLDHDSCLNDGYVDHMISSYNKLKDDNIVMLVPRVMDLNSGDENKIIVKNGKYLKRICFEENQIVRNVLTAIASGSFIRCDFLVSNRKMRDDFFIDYIDIEYSLYINKIGKEIVAVKDAVLSHKLGNKKKINFLGSNIVAYNHSSLRRYYIYRNRIWVWRCYRKDFPIYVIYDYLVSIFELFKILFLEKKKLSNIRSILKGIYAGIRINPKTY